MGWKYFANREIREYIEREKIDLAINGNGATNKKRSIVPKEMLPEMMKMDGLAELNSYQPKEMTVMTILGTKDKKADPASIRKYHFTLGGKESDLICLDTDHSVPNSNIHIVNFMAKHLLIK